MAGMRHVTRLKSRTSKRAFRKERSARKRAARAAEEPAPKETTFSIAESLSTEAIASLKAVEKTKDTPSNTLAELEIAAPGATERDESSEEPPDPLKTASEAESRAVHARLTGPGCACPECVAGDEKPTGRAAWRGY